MWDAIQELGLTLHADADDAATAAAILDAYGLDEHYRVERDPYNPSPALNTAGHGVRRGFNEIERFAYAAAAERLARGDDIPGVEDVDTLKDMYPVHAPE